MSVTRDEVSATGFDNGDKFKSEKEVRAYFTRKNMLRCFGECQDTQARLKEMADAVIRNRWHMEPAEQDRPTHCQRCGAAFVAQGCATGYGITRDGTYLCYDCCGAIDKAQMLAEESIVLYLSWDVLQRPYLSNWPGSFIVCQVWVGPKRHHNIGRTQRAVICKGPNGHQFYGRVYGDNQLVRLRPYKSKRSGVVAFQTAEPKLKMEDL